jgi:hypothetical protein
MIGVRTIAGVLWQRSVGLFGSLRASGDAGSRRAARPEAAANEVHEIADAIAEREEFRCSDPWRIGDMRFRELDARRGDRFQFDLLREGHSPFSRMNAI